MTERRFANLCWAALAVLAASCIGCSRIASEAPDRASAGLIVFSAAGSDGRFDLYSARPDGSDRKQLTRQGNNITPAWTPDGTRIIFASDRTGTRELYVITESDREPSRIATSVAGNKLTPSMSHDLSKIAFAVEDPVTGHPEIWIASADGAAPRRLTTTPKASTGPTWALFPRFSPDDARILYASTQSGSSQIWIMNADGTGNRQLTSGVSTDAPDANAPNWSPDGTRIVFWAGHETRYGEVWTMDADGTHRKQLTEQPAPISSDNPAWSPDGGTIIFDSNRSGTTVEIWIMKSDGGDQRRLIGGLGAGGVMQMSWRR